jgi:hypothetical protein
MIADTSGEDRLVPPIPNQPGTGWPALKVPHTLNGVFALPVQYSAYGVNSSALAEMFGPPCAICALYALLRMLHI